MGAIHTEPYGDLTIEIHQDPYTGDPRDSRDGWAGTLYEEEHHGRARHGLGSECAYLEDYDDYSEAWSAWLKEQHKHDPVTFAIPVRIREYGSGSWGLSWGPAVVPGDAIAERTDALYVVRRRDVLKQRCITRITRADHAAEEEVARADLTELRQWLEGEVYGYRLRTSRGEEVDACWGYFGPYDGDVLEAAKEQAEHYLKARAQKAELAAIAGL